jgi:tetratricopeptide (TPR) repeat protein
MAAMIAAPLAALVLLACPAPASPDGPPPAGPDAALAALAPVAPDDDLAAREAVLAGCGPEATTPALRDEAAAEALALGKVLGAEARARVVFPAGGKGLLQAELGAVREEVGARTALVARLFADARAMDRVDEALAAARTAAGPDHGGWAAAAALADEALADPAAARVAHAGQLAALAGARERAHRHLGPWRLVDEAWAALPSVGALVGAFFLALVFLGCRRLALGRPGSAARPGRVARYDIALYEDTADGPSAPLTLALLSELRALGRGASLTAEPTGSLGSVAVLRGPALDEQLRSLAERIDAGAAVAVGFLRVPLKDLWLWLVRLFFPPRFVWRGALTRGAGETRFVLAQRDRGAGAREEWQVRAAGTDAAARVRAVGLMACRLALAQLPAPPTKSPEAFAAHEEARAILDDLPEGAPREELERARALLERAVGEDPRMEPARVRLAGVVARLGELDLALEMVDGLIRAAPQPRPALLYEEARICAQHDDARKVRRALALSERVLASPGISRELALNAHSLRAVVAAGLLGQAGREDPASLSERERGKLQQAMEGELDFFADPDAAGVEDARAFSLARALALAAKGGFLVEAGRAHEALGVLREALVDHPDLLSAQLGIARAYRKAQPRGWFDQALPWLTRAERQAPESAALQYELGSAYLQRDPPEVDEAYAHLEKAAPRHAAALYKLGVLEAEERGEPLKGIEAVDRALAARGAAAAPYWAEKLVRLAAGMQPPTPEALELSETALRGLADVHSELSRAPPDEDADERDARLAERRRHRRYLSRTAVTLAQALVALPPDGSPAAARARGRVRETLGRVAQTFRAEAAAEGLEERDRGALERTAATLEESLARTG